MIDGENSILPILTFEDTKDWFELLSLSKPELDKEGLLRLFAALHTTAKSVFVEREYIDKDYRDTFSNYHSKRFSTPSSRCLRLHFFSDAVKRSELKDAGFDRAIAEKLNSIYLGYSVIRPTKPNCVGRTLLSPLSRGPASAFACLALEKVSILGTELEIRGFPFISQDEDVTVCAQSAIWMLLRYFSNRYSRYPETYPFQIANLTKDYSLGRIYPSPGLYVWQMAEAMRQVGFAPVIYTRNSYIDKFDHLLYTYIESGIPVLAGTENHVVVAFGHQSNFSLSIPSGEPVFTSHFNQGLIINDDNRVPYQILRKDGIAEQPGAQESEIKFDDIVDFVVPLPEKVFLPAEGFETVVTAILQKSTEFGIATLSPFLYKERLVLRLFLTSGKSFKKHLKERGMGHGAVEETYRNLPLPHFVWICEIATSDSFARHEVVGEVIWDATRNASEPNGWIAIHYPETFVVDVGSPRNRPQEFRRVKLETFSSYPLYKHNLQPI
jgi:hypothetical protein